MARMAVVRTRIDQSIKDEAFGVLEEMGFTFSSITRILLLRIVRERAIPPELLAPLGKNVTPKELACNT